MLSMRLLSLVAVGVILMGVVCAPLQKAEAQSASLEVIETWNEMGNGGVTIHVNLSLHNAQQRYVWFGVWPRYQSNGDLIWSRLSDYADPGGYLSVQQHNVWVEWDHTNWPDFAFFIPDAAFPAGTYDWYPQVVAGFQDGDFIGEASLNGMAFTFSRGAYDVSLQMKSIEVRDVEEEVSGDDEIYFQWGLIEAHGSQAGTVIPGSPFIQTTYEGGRYTNLGSPVRMIIPEGDSVGIVLLMQDVEDWSSVESVAADINAVAGSAVTVAPYLTSNPVGLKALLITEAVAASIYGTSALISLLDGNDTLIDQVYWLTSGDLEGKAGYCTDYTVEPQGSTGLFGYDHYHYVLAYTVCVGKQ